jgi:hypothetical protein
MICPNNRSIWSAQSSKRVKKPRKWQQAHSSN